jgi:hypothetical protein
MICANYYLVTEKIFYLVDHAIYCVWGGWVAYGYLYKPYILIK